MTLPPILGTSAVSITEIPYVAGSSVIVAAALVAALLAVESFAAVGAFVDVVVAPVAGGGNGDRDRRVLVSAPKILTRAAAA